MCQRERNTGVVRKKTEILKELLLVQLECVDAQKCHEEAVLYGSLIDRKNAAGERFAILIRKIYQLKKELHIADEDDLSSEVKENYTAVIKMGFKSDSAIEARRQLLKNMDKGNGGEKC